MVALKVRQTCPLNGIGQVASAHGPKTPRAGCWKNAWELFLIVDSKWPGPRRHYAIVDYACEVFSASLALQDGLLTGWSGDCVLFSL